MAITLNGNGTLTGISAGGLPDGIIQSADLASEIKLGQIRKVATGTTTGDITTSVTGTSSAAAYLGCEATITPVDSSSNFLLIFTAGHIINNQASTMGFYLYSSENSGTYTDIGAKGVSGGYSQSQQTQRSMGTHLLYEPSASSITSLGIRVYGYSAAPSYGTNYFNSGGALTITILEVPS
tara:strand:+ start:81 stop:623 length:543 start_codon:yes stop_codon:yes gene_type:complete